jgi:hypothetical protein
MLAWELKTIQKNEKMKNIKNEENTVQSGFYRNHETNFDFFFLEEQFFEKRKKTKK